MKSTKIAYFAVEQPELGFPIEWHNNYDDAINSTADYSGFYANNQVMVFSELALPVTELDISGLNAVGAVYGDVSEIRCSNTQVNNVIGSNLDVIAASDTLVSSPPKASTELRIDGNNLDQTQVDRIVNDYMIYDDDFLPIGAEKVIIENNLNADANTTEAGLIETAGGKVWQNNVGLLSFQTNADSPTSFIMNMKGAAKCDWALDNTVVATNVNNHNFVFTDDSIKTIGIRGDNVAEADYILLSGKSLIGTFDMSPMLTAAFRIDFSDNPNLNELILPQTDGEFDRLDGSNSGITLLRLDKLPGLINKKNVRITLTDCPNLDTDSVALNILAVDLASVNGRKLFLSGSPPLSIELQTQLQSNGWTIT